MTIEGEIHWCEGLLLQPHHLQTMQRNIFEKFVKQHRLFANHPYGVIEAKVSDDQLENMRVSFERLHAIMPSGLEINIPDDTFLPSLDIKEAFASSGGAMTISLGVPIWYSSRCNVIQGENDQDWLTKRTYRVAEIQKNDENTGENPRAVDGRPRATLEPAFHSC